MLIEHNFVIRALEQKEIMEKCDHPFLIELEYILNTEEDLFFVMPFITGGNLHQLLQIKQRMPEAEIKFYVA